VTHVLHYPAAAHALGVHPWEPRILAALRSHMDFQEIHDSGGVTQYMTKLAAYVTKSDAQHNEVLVRRDKRYLHQAYI
jgi:hypothetical protein